MPFISSVRSSYGATGRFSRVPFAAIDNLNISGLIYRTNFTSNTFNYAPTTTSLVGNGYSRFSTGGLDNGPYFQMTTVSTGSAAGYGQSNRADFLMDSTFFSNLDISFSFWATAASATNGPNNSIISLFGGHNSQGGIGVWTTAQGGSGTNTANVTVANEYSTYNWTMSGTSTFDHIVVVYSRNGNGLLGGSRNTARLYKNGSLVQTVVASETAGNVGLTFSQNFGGLGARVDNPNEQGNWKISNLRIFNKVLTSGEITTLQNARTN
jgi:hypothetical protein